MQKHSNKFTAQALSESLKAAQIKDIIISPGSRNAPLIIELTNQDFFNHYSIIDERSAGFVALGMAQQTGQPAVLVCTSGSALLNYYPAIAEAFYSHIPLIIVSADRPQKWVDQGEGQTIRQDRVFEKHSWYNVTLSENGLPEDLNNIKNAIETAIDKQGPVHINMPFDEPLYEISGSINFASPNIKTKFENIIYPVPFLEKFERKWQNAQKKMILVGQHKPSKFLQLQLEKLADDPSVIILNENISNVKHKRFINNIDQVIFNLTLDELEKLKPEILITIGRNFVSKKVKKFLRAHKPQEHWHIEKTNLPPNTFNALTQHFDTSAEMFLSQFLFLIKALKSSDYQQKWLKIKKKKKIQHKKFLQQTGFSDLKVFDLISHNIPSPYKVQWGNSSTIRYAQLFDYTSGIQHFANRGASGIDGSSSTAIGAHLKSDLPVLLISGDISFLYDSNALWQKYTHPNFKIIVINNGGGDIFNFIPGPSNTQALNNFFVTKHRYHMKKLADMYRFSYKRVDNLSDLTAALKIFFSNNTQAQILEIDTQKINNAAILKDYFKFLS